MLTLDDILAQPAATDTLRRAAIADRLPHGLIFAGPAGVGKATTAAALATLFLCDRPGADARPCGTCPSCLAMAAAAHPDYHVIIKELIRFHDRTGKSKGTTLSIDVVRPELVDKAGRKSTLGRGKVFIVEQADLMQPPAQNAILKTLEEPAGRTLIILITDQPDSLLQTIRSRCQTIRFGLLPDDLVASELSKRGVSPADARDAARFARGSIGTGLKYAQDGVLPWAREIDGLMTGVFSAGRTTADVWGLFKKAADDYAEKQLERDELSSKDAATREGLGLYLRIGAEAARERLAATDDATITKACDAIEAIVQAEGHLDANVNTSLVFQQLTVALERRSA